MGALFVVAIVVWSAAVFFKTAAALRNGGDYVFLVGEKASRSSVPDQDDAQAATEKVASAPSRTSDLDARFRDLVKRSKEK